MLPSTSTDDKPIVTKFDILVHSADAGLQVAPADTSSFMPKRSFVDSEAEEDQSKRIKTEQS